MKDIYFGIVLILMMIIIYLGTELYFKCKECSELKGVNRMLNERVEFYYKENEYIKKEFIYVLSRLCKEKNNLITKSRIGIVKGNINGTNDSFNLYLIYDKDLSNTDGCITKYILDMKYWDIFDVKTSLFNEYTVHDTFDLRER